MTQSVEIERLQFKKIMRALEKIAKNQKKLIKLIEGELEDSKWSRK